MGSYITAIVIAMCLVFGLYASHETTTGNSIFGKDNLDSLSESQLHELAEEMGAPDQVEAILELGKRPGNLKKTVPILAKLATVRHEMVKNAADASLEQIGADAAEHIREFVDQNTTAGFRISCSAMRAIGPGCKIYLPEIKRLLQDDNPLHRKCGLYALQGMGDDGKAAMQEIIDCVSDPDLNNQCSACRVLEKFGADAIDAETALLKLQKEGGPSTRGWAAVCLGAIGPTSSDVDIAETLAHQIRERADLRPVSPIEQQRVLKGLAHLGPEATKVADVVRAKMKGKNTFVGGHAAYALWRITGNSAESMGTFRNLLNNPMTVDDGLYLVGKMGSEGIGLASEVSRGLRSTEPGTRELAVIAIGNMGPSAIAYEGSIRERLEDTSPLVRMAAQRALDGMTVGEGESNKLRTSRGAKAQRFD